MKIKSKAMKKEEKGSPLIKSAYRYLGIKTALLLRKTCITPNQVTFISIIFGILAAFFIGFFPYPLMILGALFLQLSVILDYADGSLARMRDSSSKFGAFFDAVGGDLYFVLVYFAMSFHIYNFVSTTILPWILGFAAISLISIIKFEEGYFKGKIDQKSISKVKNKHSFLKQFLFTFASSYLVLTIAIIVNQLLWFLILLNAYLIVLYLGMSTMMFMKLRKH